MGFFSRSTLKSWETQALLKVLKSLGKPYSLYVKQIEDGMLVQVRVYSNEINYVGFKYDGKIAKLFEDRHKPHFMLEGIKIFDEAKQKHIEYRIHINAGLIAGYSTPQEKANKPDPNRMDLSMIKTHIISNPDFDKISSLFTAEELSLVNPAEIYELKFKNKTYYHLKDLEDGDFIGMDSERRIYSFTHDPISILELKVQLIDILK